MDPGYSRVQVCDLHIATRVSHRHNYTDGGGLGGSYKEKQWLSG